MKAAKSKSKASSNITKKTAGSTKAERKISKISNEGWPPEEEEESDRPEEENSDDSYQLQGSDDDEPIPRPTRVEAVCHELWPAKNNSFSAIELGKGGSHHIVAIFADFASATTSSRQLILRQKRGPSFINATTLEDDVAILRYLGQCTSLSVPQVEIVDFTSDNALRRPYVILSKIPGFDVGRRPGSGKYPGGYTNADQCSLAKSWANMLLDVQATCAPMPGRIKCIDRKDGSHAFKVVPFQKKRAPRERRPKGSSNLLSEAFSFHLVDLPGVDLSSNVDTPPFKSTLHWLQSQFEHWKSRNDPSDVPRFERLSAVASQMDEAGYFGDNQYSIYHPNLHQSPRNVIAQHTPSSIDLNSHDALEVSGVIDWDGAAFNPSFYGCEVPIWLWEGEYKQDEYGKYIDKQPPTAELRKVKKIFEKAVGPEYLHQARDPGYGLASRLVEWAASGRFGTAGEDESVNKFLDAWATICPPGTPPIPKIEGVSGELTWNLLKPTKRAGYKKGPRVCGKGKKRAARAPSSTKGKTKTGRVPSSTKSKKKANSAPSSTKAKPGKEYRVDNIVDARRFAGGHVKYKIKWTGYDEDTWEPYSAVQHLEEMLSAFETKNPRLPVNRGRARRLRET